MRLALVILLAVWPGGRPAGGAARPAAPSTAGTAGSAAEARVELEVAGVLPAPDAAGALLVLREKGADTLLPLLVPGADGVDLGRRLVPRARGRRGAPGAPGLAGAAIDALGGSVREVEIALAEETTGGARVRLAQGGRQVELPARPSESVALAVRAGAPILARRRLLDEAGLTPEDLRRAREEHGGSKGRALRL